jgi:hypothetical protein
VDPAALESALAALGLETEDVTPPSGRSTKGAVPTRRLKVRALP